MIKSCLKFRHTYHTITNFVLQVVNFDRNCSSEIVRFRRSLGHERPENTRLLNGIGNSSIGLENNGDPKLTKKVLDDYLEETDAIDLVEDINGKSGSSLVGLDLPPNFMECNRNKVKKQNIDELNWLTESENEKQKSKTELSELAKKVEAHSLRSVRAKLVAIIGKVFSFLARIFQRFKQGFYILIIFLMVKDGYR